LLLLLFSGARRLLLILLLLLRIRSLRVVLLPALRLLRLHLPILTHPDVAFTIEGQRMNWKAGELWYGDFSRVHSVKNDSQIVRVHMVIDVQINDFVLSLFPEDFIARRRAEGI